jgi:hypothetical protein
MLIFEQHVPFRTGAPKSSLHALSPVLDDDLTGSDCDRSGRIAYFVVLEHEATNIADGTAASSSEDAWR